MLLLLLTFDTLSISPSLPSLLSLIWFWGSVFLCNSCYHHPHYVAQVGNPPA